MNSFGASFYKGHFRYAVLNGDKQTPKLVDRGRLEFDPDWEVAELCDWYAKNFDLLLQKIQPELVAYRRNWKVGREADAVFWIYPCAILNLVCLARKLSSVGYGPQALTAKKLGLPKGTKPIEKCDEVFGAHPPHWDDAQRASVMVAWANLP